MSGVWIFKSNGVMELHENRSKHQRRKPSTTVRRKILEHLPTRQVVSSYASLERILRDLGWVRYYGRDPCLFQFHKPSSVDLISLPISFAKFSTIHMYDIVVKNPNTFRVRNM